MLSDTLRVVPPNGTWQRRGLVVGAAATVLGTVLAAVGLTLPGAAVIGGGWAVLGFAAPGVGAWLLVLFLPLHPFAMRVAAVDLGFSGRDLVLLSAWKEIALATVLLSLAIGLARKARTKPGNHVALRLSAPDWMAAALMVLVAVAMVAAPSLASLNQARLLLFPIGLYLAFRTGDVPTRHLPLAVVLLLTGVAVFGVVQSSIFGWDWVIKYYGTAELLVPATFGAAGVQGPRAAGTLASPNEFAFIVGIALIAALVLARRARGRTGLAWAVIVAGLSGGLALSFSRSTTVAVGLGIVAVGATAIALRAIDRRALRRVVAVAAPALALALVLFASRGGLDLAASTIGGVLGPSPSPTPIGTPAPSEPGGGPAATAVPTPAPPPGSDPSAAGHVASLRQAVSMLRDHPLGLGLGVVGSRVVPGAGDSEPLVVESWYLSLGLTFGWIGLFWAALVPLAFLRVGLRAVRRCSEHGLIAVGSAVVVGVTGIVLPTMLEPHVAYLPWLLAGLAVNATVSRERDPQSADVSAVDRLGAAAR